MGGIMAAIKLDKVLIKAIADDIGSGLSNQDACWVNGISKQSLYNYLAIAKKSEGKPCEELSEHQRNCVDLMDSLKKARVERKRERIKKLEAMDDKPAALIFLLKNEYPQEFNRQPYLIPNFDKLESYMESEYTESEIQAIRDAILKAEDRRQAEIAYNEDTAFSLDNDK